MHPPARPDEPLEIRQEMDSPFAGRVEALDRLRGLIIILMAIDHASFFVAKVHPGEFWGIPLPEYDVAAGFLTRFVTHLAAPGFFFLMGSSTVFLAGSRRRRGWSDGRIFRHLATRGLLLMLLQHLVENPAWLLGTLGTVEIGVPPPGGGSDVRLHFGVLYGLGGAMIACAALLSAPTALLIVLGTGAVLLTQVLTPDPEQAYTLFSPIVRLLLIPGHTDAWQVYYPLIPWFGVAALGMAFGRVVQRAPAAAVGKAWMVGLACLSSFVAIRIAGGFGNVHPPSGSDWIAFLNVTKYPPSLAFLLLTLGLNLTILSVLNTSRPRFRLGRLQGPDAPLTVFGQSALAFYLLHLYVYALFGLFFPAGSSRLVMFVAWFAGLVVLYPICRRYRAFKQRTRAESVWRLF